MRLSIAASLGLILFLGGCGRELPDDGVPTGVIERGKPDAGAGMYSSLAVDEQGGLHAAYYHADMFSLRMASWTGKAWSKTTVDGGKDKMDAGRQVRLAFGGSQTYLAYQENLYNDAARENLAESHVKFAKKTGKGWHTERIDGTKAKTGDFIALAFDDVGAAIAYTDGDKLDLMLARQKKGVWRISAIDEEGDVGRYVSMDASLDGRLFLAYYDGSHGSLKVAQDTGNGFQIEQVDGYGEASTDTAAVGMWTRIRAQPIGSADAKKVQPKILYYNETSHDLRLAERHGSEWIKSVVDNTGYVGTDSDLLWLANGDLIAVYFDATNANLKIARRTSGGWSRQTLLSQGGVGLFNAAAPLSDSRIAVTSYNLTLGELDFLFIPARP